VRGVDLGEVLDRREDVCQATIGVHDRLAVRHDDATGVRAGGLHRDLLAEYHAQRKLLLIDRPRYPLSRRFRNEHAEARVSAQGVHHRFGIGVEIEQSTAPCDRRTEIPKVVQHDPALHMVGLWCETDDSVAAG
jgi:hypothetical protein